MVRNTPTCGASAQALVKRTTSSAITSRSEVAMIRTVWLCKLPSALVALVLLPIVGSAYGCSEEGGRAHGSESADAGSKSGGAGSGSSSGGSDTGEPTSPSNADWLTDFGDARIDVESEVSGNCTVTAAALGGSNLARVSHGASTIYVGHDQVSADNQDPVVARVDGETVSWCRHHENDGPDGRALGISWDGGPTAYVIYTIVGGGSDLEMTGWFRSYGGHAAISGGGPKVSVLGRADTTSGALDRATHVIAVTSERKVNSHVPTAAPRVLEDGSVELLGESAHKPIGADGKNGMQCSDYPFDSKYRFSADLSSLVCAECSNCTGNVLPCP